MIISSIIQERKFMVKSSELLILTTTKQLDSGRGPKKKLPIPLRISKVLDWKMAATF
jgi:hypothetical protein